jgi:hypothetical protein
MFLTKVKMVTAVLLAVSFVGAGAGWLTFRAAAGEQPVPQASGPTAAAEPPPARAAEPPPAAENRRREEERQKEGAFRLDRAEKDLQDAERHLGKLEEEWLRELIAARTRVMELGEQIKRKEREQSGRRQIDGVGLEVAQKNLQKYEAALAEWQARLDGALARQQKANPDLQVEMTAVAKQVTRAREEVQVQAERAQRQEEDWAKNLLQYRKELIEAEERLRFLERR